MWTYEQIDKCKGVKQYAPDFQSLGHNNLFDYTSVEGFLKKNQPIHKYSIY